MYERLYTVVACFIGCVIIILLAGCRTVKSADAVGIGYEGGKAIGRAEQIYSSLADISEREALRSEREQQELERITRTANNLGDTIRSLVSLTQRILDENNQLRAELERLSKGESVVEHNTGNPYLDENSN